MFFYCIMCYDKRNLKVQEVKYSQSLLLYHSPDSSAVFTLKGDLVTFYLEVEKLET